MCKEGKMFEVGLPPAQMTVAKYSGVKSPKIIAKW